MTDMVDLYKTLYIMLCYDTYLIYLPIVSELLRALAFTPDPSEDSELLRLLRRSAFLSK